MFTHTSISPYSNKNVQQCRCGSDNCRGILGPRPKDKDQRAKLEEKTAAEKATKKVIGKKRKLAEAESSSSQKGKKRKLLTAKSIKTGVKKVVAKTTSRGKAATQKTAKVSAAASRGKAAKKVKLPKVNAASRVKAAVRNGPRSKAKTGKATIASPVKGSSSLKRPSPETKKKILARAKGTNRSTPKKSPRKHATTKAPVNARMTISKAKTSSTAAASKVKKTLTGSVKQAAKNVVRTVKGKKD